MFISCMELFKRGVGPSSSHTMGPMLAALKFRERTRAHLENTNDSLAKVGGFRVRCTLFGSLAHTGLGHASDTAVLLGLHGYAPESLQSVDMAVLLERLGENMFAKANSLVVNFRLNQDLIFDREASSYPHPNYMLLELIQNNAVAIKQGYASLGGGFIIEEEDIGKQVLALDLREDVPFPFDSANQMLAMSQESGCSIAEMKRKNECVRAGHAPEYVLSSILDIWAAMEDCIRRGLQAHGQLPGVLHVSRRAALMYQNLMARADSVKCHEWLSAYAIAVNEENASGHAVVTAPTNGAAGVVPAVLHYYLKHECKADSSSPEQVSKLIETFFLTAAAIGGLIKHNSSISGSEVGCQGEVGAATAMAAAGLCAIKGGTAQQIENAAEIALEHHLGMTCDPVAGLVQVPCIERNAFGAVKAVVAADMAMLGSGEHLMSLDSCIEAMRQTGLEMSSNYKETALGGLAKTWVEC